jgi:hypothetical protein
MDPEMEDPQHAQEDLANDPDAATVTGTITCDDGDGPYRIRLFVPPPDLGGPEEEGSGGPPSPLINIEVEDAGKFSFKTPKGDALVVLAYEDLDENGLPTLEEPQFGPLQGNPVPVKGDVSGLILDCSKPLPAPAPRMDTVVAPGGAGDALPADAPDGGGPAIEGGPGPEGGPAAEGGPMLPPDGGELPPPDGANPPPQGDGPPGDPPPE